MLLQRWLSVFPPQATGVDVAAAGAVASAGESAGAVTSAGEALLRRWSEPHRRYHDRTHLAAVLSTVDEYIELARDGLAVRLAAWYHDAVYDPRRADNEERSATLSELELSALGVPESTVAEIARLVRLTGTHDPAPDDPDGALLCDADLAILAAPPTGYDRYAAAVRREYAHVPDAAFRAGRAAVLDRLVALPELYRIVPQRSVWQARARANLHRELASLR